jgi:hypothetical protein
MNNLPPSKKAKKKKPKKIVFDAMLNLTGVINLLSSHSKNNNNVFFKEINTLNDIKNILHKHVIEKMNEDTVYNKSDKAPCIMFGHNTTK